MGRNQCIPSYRHHSRQETHSLHDVSLLDIRDSEGGLIERGTYFKFLHYKWGLIERGLNREGT